MGAVYVPAAGVHVSAAGVHVLEFTLYDAGVMDIPVGVADVVHVLCVL